MTFLIDKFFIDEFNSRYGTKLTYAEFKELHKEIREKKRNAGLVDDSFKSAIRGTK